MNRAGEERFLAEYRKAISGTAIDPPCAGEDPMAAAGRLTKPGAARLITELKLYA